MDQEIGCNMGMLLIVASPVYCPELDASSTACRESLLWIRKALDKGCIRDEVTLSHCFAHAGLGSAANGFVPLTPRPRTHCD